ncbi:hypothetical protein [Enterococcus wangshanyuanii]|uniref:hypothetical protein n=1 Tax=Enterococcus wangshanyuanii TaxID=2005703 RepID=UPI000B4ABD28|nr:hypothetical protein [Enterococcus wangshanyuanii]
MKKLSVILVVLICLISLSSCKTEKKEETTDLFLKTWEGKREDSRYELSLVKSENRHIIAELLENNVQKYKYICVIDTVTKDTLILKYEKIVLTFKLSDNEMIYTKSIDGTEGIEGTSKPIQFYK